MSNVIKSENLKNEKEELILKNEELLLYDKLKFTQNQNDVIFKNKEEKTVEWKNFEAEPNQMRTLKNIRNTLKETLFKKYGIDKEEIVDEMLKIHGLHKNNFDFLGNIEKFFMSHINDISINDNANKGEKFIKSIISEIEAPLEKSLGFDFLYQTMKGLYGKKEAKRLSGELYDFSLAISDSTKLLIPYCFSIDASKLVLVGRNFGVLKSKPSKRVTSYIAALCETIHQLSNHLAGAIAIGTFFLDIAHILIFRQNISLNELKNNQTIRKQLENNFQGFIHSVNHLSRDGAESPFTNLSIFDEVKLRSLIEENNMGWYFSESFFDIYKLNKNEVFPDQITKDYVVSYIKEVQKIFLDFFDKGDPSADGLLYRFPVVTINFSKGEIFNEETKTYETIILDQDFLNEFVNNYDVFRYNIFISEGMKVASCCFKGDEIINVYDKKNKQYLTLSLKDFILEKTSFKEILNKKGGVIGAALEGNGEYEIFLNEDDYDILSFNLEENKIAPTPITGVLIKKNDFNYLVKLTINNNIIHLTPDNICKVLEKDTKTLKEIYAVDLISKKDDYLYPIYDNIDDSIKLEKIDNVEIVTLSNKNDDDVVYDLQLKSNHYFALNNIICHNCRLINNVDLLSLAASVNSFGGTSISLGSHRVVSINFNRIALEANSLDEFWKILDRRIEDTAKILKAHKLLLYEGVKKGLHPFITNNWVNLNRMFSTFGVIGEVECIDTLNSKFKDQITSSDLLYDILSYLNKRVLEVSKEYEIIGNIEIIPGESMAIRLSKFDKLVFGEDKVPYDLYSNQIVPLWRNDDVFERLELDGKYNKLITGGGIVHIQIGEVIKSPLLKVFIEYAAKCGCEHFAINGVYSQCIDGHVNLGKLNICPICGKKIKEYYTRIVGFFVPVSNWNEVRREKDFPNRQFINF